MSTTTTPTSLPTPTPRPLRVYAVLNPGLYGTILIPREEFNRLFVYSSKLGVCKINARKQEEIDNTGMGVCVDTILQTYALTHIRNCYGRGEYRPGLHLIGSYYLLDDEEYDKYILRKSKK